MKPKKMIKNASRPEGFWGRLMIKAMNKGHSELSRWGLGFLPEMEFASAADIGCGGGKNVIRLSEIVADKVYGLDVSPLCVKNSAKKCSSLIKNGRAEIILGNASALPFKDGGLDLVTAFETVYFWKDLQACFSEIYRVISDNGVFLITNELTADVNSPDKYAKLKEISPIDIFTPQELSALLTKVGFAEIKTERKGDWTAMVAIKR